jgi:hypothetical protein
VWPSWARTHEQIIPKASRHYNRKLLRMGYTMRTLKPLEDRFHVTVYDDSGAVINFENLTWDEYNEFQLNHMDDDLDFAINVGAYR